jgi:uncharacterized Zn finger protein
MLAFVQPPGQDRDVLGEHVVQAKRQAPELDSRLDRAETLVRLGAVRPFLHAPGHYLVHDAEMHVVIARARGPWSCSCPDYTRRRDWCKHGLAAALVRRLGEGARR